MSNEIYPRTQYPDAAMPTPSAEFIKRMQSCADERTRQEIREAIKRQTSGLIQYIGHYTVPAQAEFPTHSSPLR